MPDKNKTKSDYERLRKTYIEIFKLIGLREEEIVKEEINDIADEIHEALIHKFNKTEKEKIESIKEEIKKGTKLDKDKEKVQRNKYKKAKDLKDDIKQNIQHIKGEINSNTKTKKKFPLKKLEISDIVEYLENIDDYLTDKIKNKVKKENNKSCSNKQKELEEKEKIKLVKELNIQKKLRVLETYSELTREEKYRLNLPISFEKYIEKYDLITENISLKNINSQNRSIIKEIFNKKNTGDKDDEITKYIREQVVSSIFEEKKEKGLISNPYIEEISKKTISQIYSIIAQSGIGNISNTKIHNLIEKLELDNNKDNFQKSLNKILNKNLPNKSIYQLINNIVINHDIAQEIPIKIKNVEVNRIEFPSVNTNDGNTLINKELINKEDDPAYIREIESVIKNRSTYQVKIYFCLNNKIDFVEEIKGSSSILCLIRKALNRALFWDISCLKEYFPIAQEIQCEGKLYGGDTLATISSKANVRLAKLKDLQSLLNEGYIYDVSQDKQNIQKKEQIQNIDFDCYVEGSDIIQGNYTGFDLIETIAKSGLYARLKLLSELNIDSQTYLENLERRIKEKEYLLTGKKYLRLYPFSLLIMERYFKNNLFVNDDDNIHPSIKKEQILKPKEKCSNITYQAFLHIVEKYLTEGLYITAKKMLKELEINDHLSNFNHLLKTTYYICKAEQRYLSGFGKKRDAGKIRNYLNDCKNYIDKAETELCVRTLEFFRIGQVPQGNLSPLFSYWAKIYALKGKLSLFFPECFENNNKPYLIQPLLYFGNARINALRDGNLYLSSHMALSQSWCYLMQAYLGNTTDGFGKESCINWAKKLIDQALIGYKDESEKAYQSYIQTIFSEYKNLDEIENNHQEILHDINNEKSVVVERPPIFCLVKDLLKQRDKTKDKSDFFEYGIDSKLIKYEKLIKDEHSDLSDSDKTIDMFGQHSAFYFFVYGMFLLCDNYSQDEDINNIINKFKEAFNYFYSSYSIAKGGVKNIEEKDNITSLDRKNPRDEDMNIENAKVLQAVYFHRISELVDLSKIFISLTQSLIAKSSQELEFGKSFWINDSKNKCILTTIDNSFNLLANGQEEYNQHIHYKLEQIQEHLYKKLERCVNHESISTSEFLDTRDKIVRKVFEYLRD